MNPTTAKSSSDSHPRLCVSAHELPGLRSVEQVRRGLTSGHAAALYQRLLAKADEELEQPAWTPWSRLPGRSETAIARGDREFVLVGLVARRIEDGSLAGLLTGDRKYAVGVLTQIRSIFDPAQWEEIEDLSHLKCGDVCSLRRGILAGVIGMAYDWLYGLLTADERAEIIRGFDARFFGPFHQSITAAHCRWRNANTNFIPCIYGGYELAAMAFGGDYEQTPWLLEHTRPRMLEFLNVLIEPDGEFNESVQYAGSVGGSVQYLTAHRYAGAAGAEVFRKYRLPEFCRWYMHMILPPDRVVGFGDPAADMPPVVDYFATLAAVERDGVLQWCYLNFVDKMLPTHRRSAMELLGYDPTLLPTPPEEKLPLGRAYHAQGKLVSSRSDWSSLAPQCIVYAKAGREYNHGHADWGQVCIDGYGERLIIDLGSNPGGYPETGKEFYYNYQQWGHNVLVVGQSDTGGVSLWTRGPEGLPRTYPQGKIVWSNFDRAAGGAWVMDLTAIYPGAKNIRRSVLHLLPGIVAVLDEAKLDAPENISLRWHTGGDVSIAADGTFNLSQGPARLAAKVIRLDGPIGEVTVGRHEYKPPYNQSRMGDLYPQRREPYVHVRLNSHACRLLSLFAVSDAKTPAQAWREHETGWAIDTAKGRAIVRIDQAFLSAGYDGGVSLKVPLGLA